MTDDVWDFHVRKIDNGYVVVIPPTVASLGPKELFFADMLSVLQAMKDAMDPYMRTREKLRLEKTGGSY